MAPLEISLRNYSADKAWQLIEANATTYGEMWDALQERAPLYERFIALGFAFLETNRRIHRVWTGLTTMRGSMPVKLVVQYSAYVEEILQNQKKAASVREYLEKPELLVHEDIVAQHIGNGNCVIGVSAVKQSLGLIKSFNSAVNELTGYTREELRDVSCSVLIPHLYQKWHNKIYEKQCLLLEGGSDHDPMPEQAFVIHKSNYIIPVVTSIVTVPTYTSTYCFLVKLRRLATSSQHNVIHILADSENVIDGMTSSIMPVLNHW